ncbi:hypothetical protein HYT55_03650 [Candidatus Woesearchaeota archaeon]|nr:hypothetical protein [Candidatus Woesearchaeota archaeon]
MWPSLGALFEKKDVIQRIDKKLAQEIELLLRLRDVYKKKLNYFNTLLLDYYTDAKIKQFQKLRSTFLQNDLFSREVESIEEAALRIVEQNEAVLEKRSITGDQKKILLDLKRILAREESQRLKRVLFIQKKLLAKSFADFFPLVQEFKHSLEEEGKILGLELETLTQIEDRLETLFHLKDPYATFDANSITSVLRQALLLIGITDFKLESTGSTARGTSITISDLDFVLLLEKKWFDLIINSTSFAALLNKHIPDLITSLAEINAVLFEEKRPHIQKAVNLLEVEGKLVFRNGKKAVIHLELIDDLEGYEQLLSFRGEHEEWFSVISKKRKAQFVTEVKTLKEYLLAVNLYSSTRKAITGISIEIILRRYRLKRFLSMVISECLPWTDNSPEKFRILLHDAGISKGEITRFFESALKFAPWENERIKTQRFLAAAWRYLHGEKPGFALADFLRIHPRSFCCSVMISSPKHLALFIQLMQVLFPLEDIVFIQEKERSVLYLSFHNGRTGTYEYPHIVPITKIDELLRLPIKEINSAIKGEYPPSWSVELRKSYIIAFYQNVRRNLYS